jgi:hypothetical protein
VLRGVSERLQGGCERCILERRRAQGVEAVALASVDHGEFAGQRKNGALAGGVGELGGSRADESDNGGGVDDAALLLAVLAETEDGELAAEPHALDVDGLRQIPDLLGGVDCVIVVCVHDTSVVEQNVDAAPAVDVLDHSLYVGFLGNICDARIELLGRGDDFLDLGQSLLKRRTGDVGKQDVGTLASEEDTRLETNAAVIR